MEWQGQERRRFPRVKFSCKVHIANAAAALELQTENIGPGGIRVVLNRKIARGTPVDMEIFPEPARVIKSKGMVVWIIPRLATQNSPEELFDTGIQFEGINEEDKRYIYELVERINQERPHDFSEEGPSIVVNAADLKAKKGGQEWQN